MVAPKHLFEQDLTTTLGRCQIQQLDPKYGLKILDFKLIFGIQLLDLTATQSRCQILHIKGSFCVPVPFRAVGVPVCAFSAACGARVKG